MADQMTPAQWLEQDFDRRMAARGMMMPGEDVFCARALFELIDLDMEIVFAHSRLMRWYPQENDQECATAP